MERSAKGGDRHATRARRVENGSIARGDHDVARVKTLRSGKVHCVIGAQRVALREPVVIVVDAEW